MLLPWIIIVIVFVIIGVSIIIVVNIVIIITSAKSLAILFPMVMEVPDVK